MHVLIVVAHPETKSFSHKIAMVYREGAVSVKHKVELLDLYRTKLQLGFLKPENRSEYQKNQPVRQALQEKVSRADEIVFIHPLWWGGPPAIMKNFIDQLWTPGFAYRARKSRPLLPKRLSVLPEGLLKGRRVRVFITCDDQRWINVLRLMPQFSAWYFYVIKFAGLRLASFHLFDYMKERNDLMRSRWLAKVRTIAASKSH